MDKAKFYNGLIGLLVGLALFSPFIIWVVL